jgi:isoquinoline 1-oxidoreductase beta subunit
MPNPTFGLQVTGNSNSIQGVLDTVAQGRSDSAGDAGRRGLPGRGMRIPRAAGPSAARSFHSSGRKLAYGALIDKASALPAPKDPPLKPVKAFKLIGQPLKRLDTAEKVNGKTTYSIDVMLPNMKFAALAICPEFGGRVDRLDDAKAKAIPGVRQSSRSTTSSPVVG